MENLNTSEFWDNQFKEEWEKWQSITDNFRWRALKFDIVSHVLPVKGEILEIGCGLGHFSRFLHARNPWLNITSTDFSEFAIDKARTISDGINFVYGDAHKLPVADSSVDAVIAMEIIEHLDNVSEFLNDIKRVGKPGAQIIISTPEAYGKELHSIDHVREYTISELEAVMEQICTDGKVFLMPTFWDVENRRPFREGDLVYVGKLK
jgi:2-polyprenyl-3-methyl-5-hydroxy-6-metoxy-1,4-benzoquinol methylase